MGCNCGKARRRLKELVKQSQPSNPMAPVISAKPIEVKTHRQLRIEARSKRVAARNAAILAARAKQEALQKNLGS